MLTVGYINVPCLCMFSPAATVVALHVQGCVLAVQPASRLQEELYRQLFS